jgi:hypothetical protein
MSKPPPRQHATKPAKTQTRKAAGRKQTAKSDAPNPQADADIAAFVVAAARALNLPLEAEWQPAVESNLEVTLRQTALVSDFILPDDAEPAPVFIA